VSFTRGLGLGRAASASAVGFAAVSFGTFVLLPHALQQVRLDGAFETVCGAALPIVLAASDLIWAVANGDSQSCCFRSAERGGALCNPCWAIGERAMRAVVLSAFGPPSQLVATEVPEPTPGPGQALIDVEFANITFVDTQIRAGRPPNPAMLPSLPVIPGNGVGGVVVVVSDPAHKNVVGRRVVASLNGTGGYAERVAADVSALVDIPPGLSTRDAVGLLADGRTAMLLVRTAEITAGETVLVEAAAGGVGSLLVQLARIRGARVVGAVGSARKTAIARELGAEVVVDYSEPAWVDQVRSVAGSIDVAFDGVGGHIGRAAFELLRPGGRFIAFGMASGAFTQVSASEAASRDVTLGTLGRPSPAEQLELVRAALADAEAGRLRPIIGQMVPLERAADAHAAIEQRTTIGKTLLATQVFAS